MTWGGRGAQALVAATLQAWGTTCHLCLRDGATSADHIVPRALGGDDSIDTNLRPAHALCNSRRGARSIAWFRARYCPWLVADQSAVDALAFFGATTVGTSRASPSIFSQPQTNPSEREQPAIDAGLAFFAPLEARP